MLVARRRWPFVLKEDSATAGVDIAHRFSLGAQRYPRAEWPDVESISTYLDTGAV